MPTVAAALQGYCDVSVTASGGESDDSYHAIVPWNLTICTTAREGLGARLVIG